MFQGFLRQLVTATNDPGEALIKTPNYSYKTNTYDCDIDYNFSSDCMQTTEQWYQVNRPMRSVLQSFTALLPVQLS